MVTKIATIGLVILAVGLVVGVYGVYTPVSAQTQSSVSLLNTQASVDANDYASKNTVMSQGQTINIQLSIANTTIFNFYVMNQTQYYNFYGCAPFCHVDANISGVGAVGPQNLTALVNATKISPSSPYTKSFTAPANGTYYFVLDNSVGPSWATYEGQNASMVACNTPKAFSCNTLVTLQLTTQGSVTTNSANWVVVGLGVALLLIGGGVATAMWGSAAGPAKPAAQTPATPGVVGK